MRNQPYPQFKAGGSEAACECVDRGIGPTLFELGNRRLRRTYPLREVALRQVCSLASLGNDAMHVMYLIHDIMIYDKG